MNVFALAEPAQIKITNPVSPVLSYGADECKKCFYVLILKRKNGNAVDEVNGLGVAGTFIIGFVSLRVSE